MKSLILAVCFSTLLSTTIACRAPTVTNINRSDAEVLASEGTIVFVRPIHNLKMYAARGIPGVGTRSLTEYIEVSYERVSQNSAGLLKVNIGFRNRGGRKFWDTEGPNFPISVKTAFYELPLSSTGGPTSAPVYETNWQTVTLVRGGTEHFEVVCPVASGAHYQVTVSELIR